MRIRCVSVKITATRSSFSQSTGEPLLRDYIISSHLRANSSHLAVVKALPLAAPNVEQATAMGTTKLAAPNTRSPKVCNNERES